MNNNNPRIKPYHISQHYWKTILSNPNIIPMNQRNYDWDPEPQIMKFMNDLYEIFDHTNFYEKMGSIIYYTGNEDGKEIWDGQQRLITIILILKSISYVCNKLSFKNESDKEKAKNFSNSIINFLKEDIDSMVDFTKQIKDFKKNPKYSEYNIIPKIHCINPYDNDAIINIFNSYIPLVDYENMDNIIESSDSDSSDDDISTDDLINDKCTQTIYKCNCGEIMNHGIKNFIRHLKNKHEYDDSIYKTKTTKIYKAYDYICKNIYLEYKKKDIKELKEFYQFILNNIDLNVYECSDLSYVSKIFEWENNRGKPVNTLDVIKNILLSKIPDDNKCEIYDKWNKFKSEQHPLYKDYGQKIYNCAIDIYNNINKKLPFILNKNQEMSFKELIIEDDTQSNIQKNRESTYNEINNFFKIVEQLLDIMKQIKDDRFGRLILKDKKSSISWEGYMYLILPIFYINKSIDYNLIKLLVKWSFRNINTKKNFNSLIYVRKFIDLTNNYMEDQSIKYYDEILSILHINKDLDEDNFIEINKTKVWKGTTRAKTLLYFLETCISNDNYLPNMDDDLEHIIPQNKKHELSSVGIIGYLGNLTIFEKINSKNGHKGNRSIKDKQFNKKKEQYKNSTHKITRQIHEEYEQFEESDIINRTNYLLNQLNTYTTY